MGLCSGRSVVWRVGGPVARGGGGRHDARVADAVAIHGVRGVLRQKFGCGRTVMLNVGACEGRRR